MSDACEERSGCITCGDEGVPMRVVSVGAGGAVCVDDDGARHEGIAVEFVEPVAPGDRVLVHAGVAIGRAQARPVKRDRRSSDSIRTRAVMARGGDQ